MPNTLVFPDGVRLAERGELPGPSEKRELDWARIEGASISPGFVLKTSNDERFRYYAEANVDAPNIWSVFRDLSHALLECDGSLLLGQIDDEDQVPSIAEDQVDRILAALEPQAYQLQHDGYLQFGIVAQTELDLNEVFVAATKHFKVWFSDVSTFRAIMAKHGLAEADRLQFIDEFPRVTKALPEEKVVRNVDELAQLLTARLRGERSQ